MASAAKLALPALALALAAGPRLALGAPPDSVERGGEASGMPSGETPYAFVGVVKVFG